MKTTSTKLLTITDKNYSEPDCRIVVRHEGLIVAKETKVKENINKNEKLIKLHAKKI